MGSFAVKEIVGLLLAGLAATPALADKDPRFCPNRPSLGSSACTTAPGQVQVEISGVDWEVDRDASSRHDTVLIVDAAARFGLGPQTELQVSWTALGIVRERDRIAGTVDRRTRTGDVTLALRQNFKNPDGSGFSYGVQPYVTLPVGREPVGAGDWAAGALIPVTYDLSEHLNLQFTGEVDAAVDEDGDGRHLAYSGILGLSQELGEHVVLNGELMAERDDDPAGHETRTFAAVSAAWKPQKTWQLDALAVAGLNHDAPDVRLVFGGAVLLR